jgi:hypothetical protein
MAEIGHGRLPVIGVGVATAIVPAFATTAQRAAPAAASTLTIYLASANRGGSDSTDSSNNLITVNKFEFISAEAIKVRDRSNFNLVEHNTFIATGGVSVGGQQNAWSLDPAGHLYPGNSGCSIPKGQQRLFAGSNTLDV